MEPTRRWLFPYGGIDISTFTGEPGTPMAARLARWVGCWPSLTWLKEYMRSRGVRDGSFSHLAPPSRGPERATARTTSRCLARRKELVAPKDWPEMIIFDQ